MILLFYGKYLFIENVIEKKEIDHFFLERRKKFKWA